MEIHVIYVVTMNKNFKVTTAELWGPHPRDLILKILSWSAHLYLEYLQG